MILTYLKQVCRSLIKNKTYSLLNIISLSASLTCFAFIATWVNDELRYDKFNKNYSRIFRLTGIEKTEAGIIESAVFVLAMLISCLGLWGLITFAAQQRVKEIGVRKVLGASVLNIVSLLTKDFLILVGIAIAIAAPLAYWGIHKWLQDFAYRIDIGWMAFAIAGAAAILIAVATVSF